METPRRTTLGGPALVRLVAGLAGTDAAQPATALSDRLSQWLDWNHAVALATALDGRPPAAASDAPPADAEACARVRAALAGAVAGDRAFAATEPAPARDAGAEPPPDAAFFRQRCLALQQTMAARIGELRAGLRQALAAGSPEQARLAAVDAVMEQALAPRERRLLAAVPALLERHFERLRQAAAAGEAAAGTHGTWLDAFRRDMQRLLLAELDVRLQPAEGLLAALRAH